MKNTPQTRSHRIAEIVRILLGVTGTNQKELAGPLGVSESQVSRRMHGRWSAEDIDAVAEYFGVTVATFFEEPEEVRRRMLGGSLSPWITAQCDGQLDLLDLAA